MKPSFTEPEADTALCILHALIDMGYEHKFGSPGLRQLALELTPAFEHVYAKEFINVVTPWDIEIVPELVDLCNRHGWLDEVPENLETTLLNAVRSL